MKARASMEDSGVLLCKLLKDIALIMLSICIQWDPAFKKVHLKKTRHRNSLISLSL